MWIIPWYVCLWKFIVMSCNIFSNIKEFGEWKNFTYHDSNCMPRLDHISNLDLHLLNQHGHKYQLQLQIAKQQKSVRERQQDAWYWFHMNGVKFQPWIDEDTWILYSTYIFQYAFTLNYTWRPMTTKIQIQLIMVWPSGITRAPTISWSRLGHSANWLSSGCTAVYQLGVGWDDECIGTNLTLHRIVKVSFPCQFVINSISDALEHPPRNALRLALQTIKCNQTSTSHISKLSHYAELPPLSRSQSLQFPIQISKKNWQQSWSKLSHWSCRTYPGCRLPLG